MSEEQATIVIPKVRQGSDVRITLTLTDNDVAVDWTSLSDIVAMLYSNEQRVLTGRCTTAIDPEDTTKLVCDYDADQPEFLGLTSIVIRCNYMERTKTFDKTVLEFVATTEELNGQSQVIEDPELDVTINVEDVSTSLLDNAIAAAFDGGAFAMEKGQYADEKGDYALAQGGIAADAAALANQKAGLANDAATLANTKAGLADDAATLANTKAGLADDAATLANTKAGLANDAATLANTNAGLANDAATLANTKAGLANDAATLANQKAGLANDAATLANQKAGYASDQGDYAKTQGDYAKEKGDAFAALIVDNLTTNDPAKALSAKQGKVLNDNLSQLGQEVDKLITSQNLFSLMSLFADGTFLLPNGTTSTASGWKVYKLVLNDVPGVISLFVSSSFSGGTGVSMACGYTSDGAFVENYYTVPSGVTDKSFSITPASNVSYILFSKNNNAPLSVIGDVPGVFLDSLFDNTEKKIVSIEGTLTEMMEKEIVSDSVMSLFASNSLILSGGVVTSGYPGYDLYKLPLSGLSFDVIGIVASGHVGSNYYIAYGYDGDGNPVEDYIYKESGVSNYSVTFVPNANVDYILILQPNKCVVTLYEEGNVLKKMLKAEEIVIHKETILPSATGDMSLLGRLKALSADTSVEKPGYYHRYEFTLAPGVYNMDCSADVATLPRGVFVPPYTTIKGAGIGITKLQYLYSGTNDTIMSEHSTLNMPYTTTIENLTIEAENIRYAVHSDLPEAGKEAYANDKDIILKNVGVIHYGITNGLSPTYNIPTAWGGGTFDNNTLYFENCRFFAAQCAPFASHDRTGLTKSSHFKFVGCEFENRYVNAELNDSLFNASVCFTSWGSGIPIHCEFIACRIMRYILLAVVTTYNPSAKSDYYVIADGDQLVRVSPANNSHLERHWSDGKCVLVNFENAISIGTPVVRLNTRSGRAWSPVDGKIRLAGIVLHDVEAGGIGVVKLGGTITHQILGNTFTQASTIGWDGTEWSESASIKSIAMISPYFGTMVPYTD